MVNLRFTQSSLRFSTQTLLAAGALVGVSLLVACGDSPNAEAAKNAVRNSETADRWTASAGDFRAKPELAKKEIVIDRNEPGNTIKNVKALSDLLTAAVKKDFGGDPNGKAWQQYLEQNDALKDLQKSEEIVNKSLAPSVPVSSLLKSTLNTQLAEEQLAEARINIGRGQNELQKLTAQTNNVMLTLQEIGGLAAAAEALDAQKDASSIQGKVDTATAAAVDADSAKGTVAGDLKKLQDQKADLDGRAADTQKKAEEQFATADKMKLSNKGAIAAYDAAMAEGQKTYAQATALRQESAMLDPQIANTTLDLQIAEQRAKELRATADALKNASTTLGTARTGATEQAGEIRKEIDEMRKGPTGLTAKIETLTVTAGAAEKFAADAAKKAADAQKAFGVAATNQASADRELSSKVKETGLDSKPEDPLTKQASRRGDDVAVLHILEASAANALGEAKLTAYVVANLRDVVDENARKSLTPAKQPIPADMAAANKALGTEAADAFNKAVALAVENGPKLTGPTEKAKWVADYVNAVGQYGISIAAADGAQRTSALEAARKAAKDAIEKNPALTFPGLFAMAASSGKAPAVVPVEKGSDMGHEVPAAPAP